jgi:hypothetical protein
MGVFSIGFAGIHRMGYPKVPGGLLTAVLTLLSCAAGAQSAPAPPASHESRAPDSLASPNYPALHRIFAAQSVVYLASGYALSKSWYKNPLSDFHFKDDRHVWLQQDKAGHLFTAFQISRYTAEIYRGTGISRNQRILYGALSGFVFQTPIELLDGFSPDYGFSPSDVGANLAGSALFIGQMFAWDELRILPKFSTRATPYSQVRPELLGRTFGERMLKDYNGQTYWLSASPGAFFRQSGWPAWLCISAGYGIENMVAAEFSRSVAMGYTPYRQYYLSLDIDFTRLPIRNRWLKTAALLLNSVKVPAPTLAIGRGGSVSFRPLYF